MGIYLCVIADDFQGPVNLVDGTYRRNRYTNDGVMRRLRPSVNARERLPAVVMRILAAVPHHSLDALLIFAHGYLNQQQSRENGFEVPTFKLGRGLTAANASLFRSMTHLWSRRYDGATQQGDFRSTVPRIELHVCYAAEMWNRPIVQALARAAQAPVFASGVPQMVENRGFEGRVSRFNPC